MSSYIFTKAWESDGATGCGFEPSKGCWAGDGGNTKPEPNTLLYSLSNSFTGSTKKATKDLLTVNPSFTLE